MAATDARPVPLKNVAFRAVFPILDADGDLVTGAASLDSEVSKDQGAFADCTNEATEIATSSGIYYLDLTSTEMNADCVAVIVKTGTAGAKTTVLVFYPEEAGDINVDVTAWLGTAAATPTVAGVPEVDVTHWIGTAAATPTVAGVPEVDLTHLAGSTTPVTNLNTVFNTDFAANYNTTTDTWKVAVTHWIATAVATPTVNGVPEVDLTHVAGATTDVSALATNVAAILVDTAEIGAAGAGLTNINLPNQTMDIVGNITGNLSGSVGSVTGAVGSVTGNIGGNVTGSIGSLAAQAKADVEAEVGDALAAYHVVVVKTTIATLASQTSFTLTAGSADNDAYNGCEIVIEDSATAAQKAVGVVEDYTGATKTVTLRTDPAVFTMATGDVVTIRPSRSLKSTVDNRTLDVTAGGAAGLDWANVETPGSTVNLAATTLNLVNTLTTYTGNTPQTGDSYAIVNSGTHGNAAIKGFVDDIGVAGAGLTAIPDSAGVTTLLTRIPSALFSGITSLAQWLGIIAGKQTGNSTARTELRATGAGSGTYDETTDSQEALRDRGDAAWITATGFSTLDAAGVRAAVGLASANLDTQLADIPTVAEFEARTLVAANYATAASQTTIAAFIDTEVAAILAAVDTEIASIISTLGVAGAGLTALGDTRLANLDATVSSRATPAQVNTEVLDVLNVDTLIDGKTIVQSQQYVSAICAGRVSGAGTGTEVFKGLDEATTRVTVTVDASGNRTDIVYG